MIGLGSNRLSVCRQGGMSVTQAGRGGMEWLGVRGPSWASPYSAQATAALKDAFSAEQWAIIMAYGLNPANAAMVPFINEDPMLVCSLGLVVPGDPMPWRGMDNGGSSYADTGYTIRNNSDFEFVVRSYGYVNNTSLFGVNRGGCVALVQFSWGGNYCILQDQTGTNWSIGIDTIVHKLVRENYLCYNNGVYGWTSTESTTESTGTFYIGKANGGSWTNPCRNDIYRVKFQDGNLNWKTFLPYKRKVSDNEYVMEWLNIEDSISSGSKVYATRYGTFSEVFSNPDGTPWTPAS